MCIVLRVVLILIQVGQFPPNMTILTLFTYKSPIRYHNVPHCELPCDIERLAFAIGAWVDLIVRIQSMRGDHDKSAHWLAELSAAEANLHSDYFFIWCCEKYILNASSTNTPPYRRLAQHIAISIILNLVNDGRTHFGTCIIVDRLRSDLGYPRVPWTKISSVSTY